MKVRAFNIEYDTDGEDINLPYEVFVEVEDEDDICAIKINIIAGG